jgi:DUF1365 family protein
MRSALYEGTIRHRRFAVRERVFRHRLALVYADLDELPRLFGGRLIARRPGFVRFRRADYLGDPAVPLAADVRALVARRTGSDPGGPVRLLTQPRTLGHCFNPVSFYYCFRPGGEHLAAVVAEVTNTPWGERHAYVLPSGGDGPVLDGEADKALHVSPFMAMDQRYTWRASRPGATLSVHIASTEHGAPAFDATLSLRRTPLTRRSLARVCLRYPAATLRVLALIYGHAAVLWLRRVPVHAHPAAEGR